MFLPRLAAAFALVVALASVPLARAAPAKTGPEIEQAVRAYMTAIDAGDLDAQMRFWSADSTATSVIMGEAWSGMANIRARSAQYVPVSRLMRNEVGRVSVVPLGGGTVLSVTPYRPARRDPANEKLKPYELDSMLTLVWSRTKDGWRIVHEHVSVKVPPPSAP